MSLGPLIEGRFTATASLFEEAVGGLRILDRLLDEPELRQGTLEGRTAAAVIGESRRAVMRDVVDNLDSERGCTIQVGDDREAIFEMRLMGPLAPAMDVAAPLAGMRTAVDLALALASCEAEFAPDQKDAASSFETKWIPIPGKDAARPAIVALQRDAARLVLADLVAGGEAWGPTSKLEIAFATPLAPFSVRISTGGGAVGRIGGELSHLVPPDSPALLVPGVMSARAWTKTDFSCNLVLKASGLHLKDDEVSVPDAMARLRLTAAVKRAVA